MEKEFVSYELAVKLKELGFDDPCCGYYDNWFKELDTISSEVCERLCKHDTHIKAPTFSQAFRWFRNNHYAFHEVFIDCEPKMGVPLEEDLMFSFTIHFVKEDKFVIGHRDTYQTQEDAELACLTKLIEIIEEKNNLDQNP